MAGSNWTTDDIKRSAVAHLNKHLLQDEDPKKKKRSKYNNVKVEFDGKIFDSQKECNRYISLRTLLMAGVITDLQCQVEYLLESEEDKIAYYVADFVYQVVKTGEVVVEDVKSPATRRMAVYRLKKKLMLAIYKIEIKEV